MDLEIIIVSEVRKINIWYRLYMWNLKKIQMNLFTKLKTDSYDIENKLMVMKGEGEGEVN